MVVASISFDDQAKSENWSKRGCFWLWLYVYI